MKNIFCLFIVFAIIFLNTVFAVPANSEFPENFTEKSDTEIRAGELWDNQAVLMGKSVSPGLNIFTGKIGAADFEGDEYSTFCSLFSLSSAEAADIAENPVQNGVVVFCRSRTSYVCRYEVPAHKSRHGRNRL